jgi:hypothetical protein
LNARFPIGQSISGLCHFVIHDKDSTPILQVSAHNFLRNVMRRKILTVEDKIHRR